MRNRIHAYPNGENFRCPALDLYTKAGQAWLATVELPHVVRRQVDLVLANHALTTQVQALDRYIKAHVKRDATAQRLQTIPGSGPFGAPLLQAEIRPSRASVRRRTWRPTPAWSPPPTAPHWF